MKLHHWYASRWFGKFTWLSLAVCIFVGLLLALWSGRGVAGGTTSANKTPGAFIGKGRIESCDSPSFLCAHPNGAYYYVSMYDKYMRRLSAHGKIIEFNEGHIGAVDFTRWARIQDETRNDLHDLMYSEPALMWITNMRRYGDAVVLLQCYRKHLQYVRYVQVLDADLKLIRTWEDSRPSERGRPAYEPLAPTPDGSFVALGERGEILWYTSQGQVTKRFKIPGLFSETRAVAAEPIHEETRMLYSESLPDLIQTLEADAAIMAKLKTDLLVARDARLPAPIALSGPILPSDPIDMDAFSNTEIAILDSTQRVFRLCSTGLVTQISFTGYTPLENERLVALRVAASGNLFLFTSFRVLHVVLAPTPHVAHSVSLPENKMLQVHPAWDILSVNPPTIVLADPFSGTLLNLVLTAFWGNVTFESKS